MAGQKPKGDLFANLAALYFDQTAANTDTFVAFNFPYSIQDKVAIVIHRIEYWLGSLADLNTTLDIAAFGLCVSKTLANIMDQTDPLIVDQLRIQRLDIGAAGTGMLVQQPYVKDFAALPGGGIITPPSPLYAFLGSTGAAATLTLAVRFYYTYKALSTEEYWELVETRRIISG